MSKKKKSPATEKAAADDVFERSLDEYKGEDVQGTVRKKRKKSRKAVNAAFIAVIAVCAAVLVVCIVLIVKNISDKERGREVYDEAAAMFDPAAILGEDSNQTKDDEDPASMYDKLKRIYKDDGDETSDENQGGEVSLDSLRASITWLKQINDDVVGWIYVEDTTINYPLMRSTNGDDDYYLDHAYNGEYLSVGSIYMVSSCDPVPSNNYNTLIYGHNVVNGAMFHDVMKFLDQDFFTNHQIFIYTLDGVYVYQPFSIYKTQSDYHYIDTYFGGSEEAFLSFAAEMKANSSLYSDVSVGAGDKMLTLSTCTGTGVVSDARYALHAKLIDFIG